MKIFVAIPVYDGKLQHQTVECLMLEQSIAGRLGDELHICFVPNCSHPADGRNLLVQAFIDSTCDRLVFLDADITFEPGALIKIAHAPFDFAAGCTRHKREVESYPIGFLDNDELWLNRAGLIEIAMIGTAFMSLSRNVFETLKTKNPERAYELLGKKAHCYFQTPFENGVLFSEDAYFCKEWRAAGGQIYLNPELEVTHWDFKTPYVGHIGNWLRKQMKETKNEKENLSVVALSQNGTAENHPQP